MKQTIRAWVFRGCLLAAACCGGQAAQADTIITKSGQTLEGVIKDENQFIVHLDNRGNIIAVPKARIRTATRKPAAENVKMLLDRALEAVGRMDVTSARAYVEQAQTLNITSEEIRLQVENVNKKIQEMEIRGGSKEEQLLRAQTLLERAKDAYDMIRNEEGNRLLLQSLQTDPSYEKAQQMIISRLVRDNGIAGGRPAGAARGAGAARNEPQMSAETGDILLAAKYFTLVVWPDNEALAGRADSPLLKLLPRVYGNLASLFDESSEPDNAVEYAQLLKKLAEAFAAHPAWKDTGDPKLKYIIDKPVDSLLAEMVKKNVDKGGYELALRKLKGWTTPDASPEICQLYLRALEGAEQYSEASVLLEKAIAKFPEQQTSLRPRLNALKRFLESQQLEKSDPARAITTYEDIYAKRKNLSPEIGDTVGRQLARLKGQDMDPAAASGQIWRAADIAALVMQYGQDQAMRRHAAELIIKSLHEIPWRLDLVWCINGTTVTLTDDIGKLAQKQLRQDLSVTFDQASPFEIRLTINALTNASTAPVVEALRTGQTLSKPADINDFQFTLEAKHSTLGSLYKSSWTKANVPRAVAQLAAATPTPASGLAAAGAKPGAPGAPGGMPGGPGGRGGRGGRGPMPGAPGAMPGAPGPMPGARGPMPGGRGPMPGGPGAMPGGRGGMPGAPGAMPGGAVAVSRGGRSMIPFLNLGSSSSTLLTIKSMADIKDFVDKRLLAYVKEWPKVTVLPTHLTVPKAQELLTRE